MLRHAAAAAALVTIAFVPFVAPVTAQGAPATSAAPSVLLPVSAKYKFSNCTALNKVYAHGVGKSGAHDKTSGKPVTNFKHSTSLYKKIIGHRSGLDRDKDGIACEKH
jgi:hypothetical protein